MYNYFSQSKANQKNGRAEQSEKRKQLYLKRKKYNDQVLIERFIRRTKITLFKQQQNDLNSIHQYKDPSYKPRETHKEKIIGPPGFYFQDRTSKHRIKDAVHHNKILDDVPFNDRSSPTTHRYRDQSLQPSFKFTSYNTTSRVMEAVKGQTTNVIESSWDLSLKKYNEKIKRKIQRGQKPRVSRNSQSRNILPSLNFKLYPKTLESVQNTIEVGTLKGTHKNQIQTNTISLPDKQNQPLKIKRAHQNKNIKFSSYHLGDDPKIGSPL